MSAARRDQGSRAGGAVHPERVWRDVRVQGGAEGLVAFRRMTAQVNLRGYLYDLWLLERLADALAATTLPTRDVTARTVPYRMG